MKKVTLSFDNGPTADHTDAIAELLNRRGIKASFFVVGTEMEREGAHEIMARAHALGHWICNHTYSHGAPLGFSEDPNRAAAEIGKAQALIGKLSHPDRFFRPNGAGDLGHHLLSRSASKYLANNGYTVVTWNNVPGDWVAPAKQWVDRALTTMHEQDWSLVVLHEFLTGPMLQTLSHFIDEATALGAEFVQEFPPDCLHMVSGVPKESLASITVE